MNYNIEVNILRWPVKEDWERCKDLALRTMGKKWAGREVTEEWKRQMLKCEHSPIRTLMFTIEMIIPSYVSVHFVRHKIGVEHYVQSQRNDRQTNYDRELAPQNAMVMHTMDINAEQLMFMSRRRLCGMADATTRYVMAKICAAVLATNPEFEGRLAPMCEYRHECPEFVPCGHWAKVQKRNELQVFELDPDFGKLVEANGGYCPCATEKTEDTFCPCKDFREQNVEGDCHCGRYTKFLPVVIK